MEPVMDPRTQQGETLKVALMALRSAQSPEDLWPWKHPFEHIHSSALHEAGHAILAFSFGRQLCKITVLRDQKGDGNVGREIREGNPKDATEEVLIKFAGYEAARLYGFETDDHCDATDVERLKNRWPVLKTIKESEARACVRQALIDCRWALEDLAVALFTSATIDGECASRMIAGSMPEPGRSRLVNELERLLHNSFTAFPTSA